MTEVVTIEAMAEAGAILVSEMTIRESIMDTGAGPVPVILHGLSLAANAEQNLQQ